jgi:glycosyltransferase involved in cell wall biosynthesis
MPSVVSVFGNVPTRIGGAESFARELSRQLHRVGWSSILCFPALPAEPVRQYLEGENVAFDVLADSWDLAWRPTLDFLRLLRRHHPEIVHLHFTGLVSLLPWAARLSSVSRVFFTDQSSRPEGYIPHRAPYHKRVLTRALDHPLTGVISVSSYSARCLRELDVLPASRLHTIYNGVDLTRVVADRTCATAFRRRHSIAADRAIVAQISWMIPEKGIVDLLEVARIVVARHARVQFVLVGDGAHQARFAAQANKWGLREHITWTGQIDDPFAEGVFAAADVVCQLSRWEEAFGWVIAEGMACDKPIVATRVGGIPEIVEDGTSGFLVARGDVAAAAERILALLDDATLRERMGRAGRQIVEERFELTRNVAKVVELYGLRLSRGPSVADNA